MRRYKKARPNSNEGSSIGAISNDERLGRLKTFHLTDSRVLLRLQTVGLVGIEGPLSLPPLIAEGLTDIKEMRIFNFTVLNTKFDALKGPVQR